MQEAASLRPVAAHARHQHAERLAAVDAGHRAKEIIDRRLATVFRRIVGEADNGRRVALFDLHLPPAGGNQNPAGDDRLTVGRLTNPQAQGAD